jgi:serine/threonine protein phosphatase PrpC
VPRKISYASVSDVGSRKNNEDSIAWGVDDPGADGARAYFALADGLGGHGAGEVASKIAVEEAEKAFKAGQSDLAEFFLNGQDRILETQRLQDATNAMKTTLVCLLLNGDTAQWGHVGDSRLYLFSGDKLVSRTLDHSVPQMLVATGEIRERDIRHHEDRNRLIRVMGVEWSSPKFELSAERELTSKDSFLLCSDGFWEYIEEKDMQRLLRRSESAEQWLEAMLKIAAKNARDEKRDNFSALAVFIR